MFHFFGDQQLTIAGVPTDVLRSSDFTWESLANKPLVFPPSAHSHLASDLPASIAYKDAANTFTQNQTVNGNITASGYLKNFAGECIAGYDGTGFFFGNGFAASDKPCFIGYNSANNSTTIHQRLACLRTLGVNDTTQSTSSTTGSITTNGGVGIAKDLFVGGSIILPGYTLSGPIGNLTFSTPYAANLNFSSGQSGQYAALNMVTAEGKSAGLTHYDTAHANGRRLDLRSQTGVPITIRPGESLAATFGTDGSTRINMTYIATSGFLQWEGGSYPTLRYANGGDLQVHEGASASTLMTVAKTTGNVAISGTLASLGIAASGTVFCDRTTTNAFVLNSSGVNYGQISVKDSTRWQLGYGGLTTIGTSVLCWGPAGVDVTGTLGFSQSRFQQSNSQTLQTQCYDTSLAAWQETSQQKASPSGALYSVLGATPIAKQTHAAVATDLATAITRLNQLCSHLTNFGFFN